VVYVILAIVAVVLIFALMSMRRRRVG